MKPIKDYLPPRVPSMESMRFWIDLPSTFLYFCSLFVGISYTLMIPVALFTSLVRIPDCVEGLIYAACFYGLSQVLYIPIYVLDFLASLKEEMKGVRSQLQQIEEKVNQNNT